MTRLPILWALASAVLFGLTTPIAKSLALPPFELAGLLYLGSGVGLLIVRCARDRGWTASGLLRSDLGWFFGSILFGGVLAPVCLMIGLAQASAATASLLLNFESLLTAIVAWVVFREHATRLLVIGMVFIFAGGIVLTGALTQHTVAVQGAPWIILACLGWALDNNLTRPISGGDALFLAAAKGVVAGSVNVSLAAVIGEPLAAYHLIVVALILGLIGYGVSLVLFVRSLRLLGAARTGAYFASAPFIGALFAFVVLGELPTLAIVAGGLLMLVGVIIHVVEEHEHEHQHEALTHTHSHVHDEHHQHDHDDPWPDNRSHTHEHTHAPLRHRHAHYPDLHHQHTH